MRDRQLLEKVSIVLAYLQAKQGYKQIKIVKKLKNIDIVVSPSSISNLYKNPDKVGLDILLSVSKGLDVILKRDLCKAYNLETKAIENIDGCMPDPIPLLVTPDENSHHNTGLTMHDGRLAVSEKVHNYQLAKKEIIEIGLRLSSFNNYFSSKRASLFKTPLLNILASGVSFKCFVADPEGQVKSYLTRMSVVNKKELETLNSIQDNHQQLIATVSEINALATAGKMNLYKYTCPPNFHAIAIDKDLESGKIIIAPYLYGLHRSNCPVIEVTRRGNRALYANYLKSIKAFINPPNPSEKIISII